MDWDGIVFAVRSLAQDAVAPQRYSDEDIRAAVNNGLALSFRLRPDLYVTSHTMPVLTEDDTGELPLDAMYQPALAEHAAGWLMLRDDEYTTDGRAAALLGLFRTALTGRTVVNG